MGWWGGGGGEGQSWVPAVVAWLAKTVSQLERSNNGGAGRGAWARRLVRAVAVRGGPTGDDWAGALTMVGGGNAWAGCLLCTTVGPAGVS